MTEEIQSIRSAIDDLRDSADDMERALNAVTEDENRLMSRVSWLEAENTKLREMCRDMAVVIRAKRINRDIGCTRVCPRRGDCNKLRETECWYERRMRELGIEA